jgi:hypothetical protein
MTRARMAPVMAATPNPSSQDAMEPNMRHPSITLFAHR